MKKQRSASPPRIRAGKAYSAVTLLELLAVVLIVAILATIAQNVYTGQIDRARVAATATTIRELGIAITRYEIDTGEFPPSGSATVSVTTSTAVVTFAGRLFTGSGLLHLALVHSLSGSALTPIDSTWQGPYISFQSDILGTSTTLGQTQILDPWGTPIQYIRSVDYIISGPTRHGTLLFTDSNAFTATDIDGTTISITGAFTTGDPNSGSVPRLADAADDDLPNPNPFDTSEFFYNFATIQLWSFGSNLTTFGQPDHPNFNTSADDVYAGTEKDDINNFGY